MTQTDHTDSIQPPPPPPPPPPASSPRTNTPLLTTEPEAPQDMPARPGLRLTPRWRFWLAVSAAAFIGVGIGAAGAQPETKVETRTREVEAQLTDAEEDSLRQEGADEAQAELDGQREALLEQGRQEGRQALTDEQAAAAAQAAAEQAAAEVRVGPGTLVVGTDIQPGLYRTEAGTDIMDSVYWARLSSLSGDFDSIIANDNVTGVATVEIKASDVAFETDGVWTKVG
jgi:hypothetical protein